MPPEPSPSCHGENPEDTATRPPGEDSRTTALENVARAGDVSRLTESEELYWGLAQHDESYRTLFGEASQALDLLPELGDVAASLVPETTVVADIPSFLQKKIDSGDLTFQVDRGGDNLAHLVDRGGRMRHVLRLDTRRLTPELSQAWSNLRTRALQLETMRRLCDIEEAVSEIRARLQDDRLALVDSAWSLIKQACAASDAEYRKDLLRRALVKADEGRAQLARSIDPDLTDLAKHREHEGGLLRLLVDEMNAVVRSGKSLTERNAERAEQVVRSVAAMESATRAMALVHMHHGEPDAARTALGQFQGMLRQRRLDDVAVVTALSSFARKDQKPILARVLSSRDRALEICGAEPVAVPMLSPGAADLCGPVDEGDPAGSGAVVPTCSQCGRDIEAGAVLCAYHRGKHREKNSMIVGGVVSAVPAVVAMAKHAPKFLSAGAKVVRSIR